MDGLHWIEIGLLGLDKSGHLAHRLGLMTITTTAIGQVRVSRLALPKKLRNRHRR